MKKCYNLQQINLLLVLLMLGSLSACAVNNDLQGASWVVVGKIEIAPNEAGIYFQRGKPLAQNRVDRFQPWCQLVFQERVNRFRILKAGRYEISRVVYDRNAEDRVQFSYNTYMRLKSLPPIQLNQIICGQWDDRIGDYLSNDQMAKVLAGVMRLEKGK